MQKGAIVSLRSNCRYLLNYQTSNLEPEAEVIFIVSKPAYRVNDEGKIEKYMEVGEQRVTMELSDVNRLIGELQNLAASMVQFDQLGGAFNQMIETVLKVKNNEEKTV
jgi:hypothetical protein